MELSEIIQKDWHVEFNFGVRHFEINLEHLPIFSIRHDPTMHCSRTMCHKFLFELRQYLDTHENDDQLVDHFN